MVTNKAFARLSPDQSSVSRHRVAAAIVDSSIEPRVNLLGRARVGRRVLRTPPPPVYIVHTR